MNFLWIVTTQWRGQACGYAGDPNAHTPALDAFASESINFTEAVTPHPLGPFARAALITGQSSPGNGVVDYYDPLPTDVETIAHRLNALAYDTAFFGKWHLARRDPAAPLVGKAHAKMIVPPEARGGFGFWEGFESGFQLTNPWLHGSRLPEPQRFDGYQSDVICERAGGWISERRKTQSASRPWFCLASLEPPHPPYDALGATDGGAALQLRRNVPLDTATITRARRELAGYYAQITATDAAVGRLLALVDFATTTVVFTSVHGDMHGSHGLFRKGWPYEESVRVPLLVRIPGQRSATANTAISLEDLPAATLAMVEAGGTLKQGGVQVDLLKPRTHAHISMPSVVNLPWQCDRVWRGLRSSSRKLIVNAEGTPWLFYDLDRDPDELENLAAEPAAKKEIADLREQIRP